ncbi:MAG TPA: hypothetical protein VLG76_07995 [Rhabdochlamydiaceae bacterium]|nr:hypothetical protein [Rhabdochlamydiaceae bacterium]
MGQGISNYNTGISGQPMQSMPRFGELELHQQRVDTFERICDIARRAGADRQERLATLQAQVMSMNSRQLTQLNCKLGEIIWDEYGTEILITIATLVVIILAV